MSNSRLKILLVVVGVSTIGVLSTVLGLLWTMPPLPKRKITDDICLPDSPGQLMCGKTEYRLYEYTKKVSILKLHTVLKYKFLCLTVYTKVFILNLLLYLS